MPLDHYVTLGRSGLRVSPFALGAMTFGEDPGGAGCSVEESEKILSTYLDLGGNFIDTANFYTNGHSEKILGDYFAARPGRREHVVLAARELQLRPGAPSVSFELRAGEVLGVAGLVGSGRSRLAQALAGIRPAKGGEILRDGSLVKIKRPRDAVRAGIAVIPEDRKREGLILAHSIRENVGLASLDNIGVAGVVRRSEERRLADTAVARFGIRTPTTERPAGTLSGGNQQKVVLGKWLVREPPPEVAVLDEPTRGVDVGAKYEIYRLIDELVEAGAGVLLISSELPEVIAMSDRIMVMSGGYVVGTLEPEQFSEERILHLAVLGQAHGAGGEDAPSAGAEQRQGAAG